MRFTKLIETVDTHTFGEPTRSIVAGVPSLIGNTMEEKRVYFEKHYDWIRTASMLEPRGGSVMSGAVLTEPCSRSADFGVLFIDSGGYFPMCGHSTVGVTTMLVETGMIPAKEPETVVKLDTPAGLVTAHALVREGCVISVTFENVPCFLHKTQILNFEGYGAVEVDVAYGGGTFALVPAKAFNLAIEVHQAPKLIELAGVVLEKVNSEIGFRHPLKPELVKVEQLHWYSEPLERKDVNSRSGNVFIPGIDRSPCGTGTCARAITEYSKGKLALGEEFAQEGLTAGRFSAKIIREVDIGGIKGGVPTLTGSAHIMAFNKIVLDHDDPLALGFPF